MVVFEIGAKVIYPSHGVAEIVGRESRAINGATETYLVLSVLQPGWGTRGWMKVSLPEDRAAISREDASDIIELLGMSDVHVPGNWSRRFKNHQEKLRSGDVYACAEVVRNLALRQRKSSLAAAETAMYARARHSLISELAVSWGIGDDEAETRVDGALEPLVAD
jgi:CarD family transcriptional regulator